MLTTNIDGYIPLKFQAGKTYRVSCDDVSRGTRLNLSTNKSGDAKSLGMHESVETPSVNGQVSDSTSTKLYYGSVSKEGSASPSKELAKEPNADSKTERLKAMILSDRSGNAMRRLQAAALTVNAPVVSGLDRTLQDPHSAVELPSNDEPVKPPRRGAGSKNPRDNAEAAASSYMDVTAAI